MIKAIIFDCFGVLTRDKWKEFVFSLPEELRQPARDLNHSYDAGFIDEKQFISEIKAQTGRSPGEVETVNLNEMGKNTELLDYIRGLKAEYKIGLLSNIASNWIREKFLTKEEQALFDEIVLSFEVGLTKPDPRIYDVILQRLDVEPQETVFVDDIETYCRAAAQKGIKTIVYSDFSQMKTELEKILEPTN